MSSDAKPGFVVEGPGPGSLVAVFEDDGETGYLYLSDETQGILRDLHIYNCRSSPAITEDDVFVTWSTDFTKLGVVIGGLMCGVIDRKTGLAKADGRGIVDAEWLDGFEREASADE